MERNRRYKMMFKMTSQIKKMRSKIWIGITMKSKLKIISMKDIRTLQMMTEAM